MSSASTRIVNRLDKTSFTASKKWVNGSDLNRPKVEFVLYSDYIDPTTGERTDAQEITRATLDGTVDEHGEAKPWVYTFNNLKHYVKDEDGKYLKDAEDKPVPYRYFVKEEKVPGNYTVDYDGSDVINTYVSPPINVTATKTWRGGENVETPSVYFRLMREAAGGIPHAVPNTEIKGPFNGDVSFTWENLDKTDSKENIYRYFVEELIFDDKTDKFIKGVPEHYELTGSDLDLINTYVPKTGTVEATKTWIGGEKTVRPTIYFELQRKTAVMEDYEVVPDTDVRELVDGVETVTWEVDIEDTSGLPYEFRVLEGTLVEGEFVEISPGKYEAVAKDLNVTNTYVIDRGEVTATKTWHGGSKIDRADVYFKLQSILAGLIEDVPNAEILKLEGDTVTWYDIELETFEGVPYEFTVVELSLDDATGELVESVPDHQSEVAGLEVTNIYVSPIGEVSGTKKWVGGSGRTRPTIWFKLYRESDLVEYEAVPDVDILKLAHGVTEVRWNNIELKDFEGNDYQFTVKEVDQFGKDFVPKNYNKTESGLIVVNTFNPVTESPDQDSKGSAPSTGEHLSSTYLIGIALIVAAILLVIMRRRKLEH